MFIKKYVVKTHFHLNMQNNYIINLKIITFLFNLKLL